MLCDCNIFNLEVLARYSASPRSQRYSVEHLSTVSWQLDNYRYTGLVKRKTDMI